MELPSIHVKLSGHAEFSRESDSSPLSSPPPSSLFLDYVDDFAQRPPRSVPSSPPNVSIPVPLSPSPPPVDPMPALEPARTPMTPKRAIEIVVRPEHDAARETAEARPGTPKEEKPAEKVPSTPVTVTLSGRRVTQKRMASATQTSPSESTATKRGKQGVAEAARIKRRKREAAKWQTDFVLSNAKSPLGDCDIRALLCHPEAWSVLSKEEQQEVLSLFPNSQQVVDPDTDQARPNIVALKNDDNFRHDCARYQTDLQGGFHDKAWLAEAFTAHELRKMGFFDQHIAESFERDWGVKIPDEHKPPPERGDDASPAKESIQAHANGTENTTDNKADPVKPVNGEQLKQQQNGP